jgi:monothiol glutaredoxin
MRVKVPWNATGGRPWRHSPPTAGKEHGVSIEQISAPELKAMIDSGATFQFVDVRTDMERGIAHIEGSRLLDQAYFDELIALPKDTPLVFQCHHGVRSQSAAQHFAANGFTKVYNLIGGIEAWSVEVDPKVPRY